MQSKTVHPSQILRLLCRIMWMLSCWYLSNWEIVPLETTSHTSLFHR